MSWSYSVCPFIEVSSKELRVKALDDMDYLLGPREVSSKELRAVQLLLTSSIWNPEVSSKELRVIVLHGSEYGTGWKYPARN